MRMQGKINVLHDHSAAAGVRERDIAKLETLAERPRRRNRVRRGPDGRLHREEIEKVFEEDSLLGNVVEAGENLLDIGARAVEGAGQEGEAAEGHGARQGLRQDYRIGT